MVNCVDYVCQIEFRIKLGDVNHDIITWIQSILQKDLVINSNKIQFTFYTNFEIIWKGSTVHVIVIIHLSAQHNSQCPSFIRMHVHQEASD